MRKFIAFEGIDGSGKTTISQAFMDYISTKKDRSILYLPFPSYDGKYGKIIREILGNKRHLPSLPILSTLFSLDRMEELREWQEEIESVDHVIFDRFTMSTMVYQDNLSGDIPFLEYMCMNLPIPFYIYLDITPELSFENNQKKSGRSYVEGLDIHEENIELQIQCRKRYLYLMQNEEGLMINVHENGQLRPIYEILSEIIEKCENMNVI